jgi:hypothetical protein
MLFFLAGDYSDSPVQIHNQRQFKCFPTSSIIVSRNMHIGISLRRSWRTAKSLERSKTVLPSSKTKTDYDIHYSYAHTTFSYKKITSRRQRQSPRLTFRHQSSRGTEIRLYPLIMCQCVMCNSELLEILRCLQKIKISQILFILPHY